MTLNSDCIRDILLEVEKLDFNTSTTIDSLSQELSNYTYEEIEYCCVKLNEANFLNILSSRPLDRITPKAQFVESLTFSGHEFLANIKTDTNWNKTKDIAKKVGSFSVNTIKDIAVNIVSELIKNQF